MLILALGRSVASLLADVEPADAGTVGHVAAGLTTAVLLACRLRRNAPRGSIRWKLCARNSLARTPYSER
jgi:glutamate/tyrosine decarboxylase-like PLP-dependent enzyme